MKKFIFAMAMILGGAAFAQDADPVLGVWKTQVDDGAYAHVDIHMCGALICGTIAQTFNADGEYESPNKGKDILRDMAPAGAGKYAGKVWRPSNDKIYIGKLTLNGDNLKMRGCIAGGLLCSKQEWSRIQ